MKISERSERTKKVALCAMLSALGVVVLYLGSIIEVIDISMAVIASVFAIFAVIEYGAGAAWSIYAITGILSAVLLPNKFPALMYILFFGFYQIVKEKIEKLFSEFSKANGGKSLPVHVGLYSDKVGSVPASTAWRLPGWCRKADGC